jgi:hypothetical protein
VIRGLVEEENVGLRYEGPGKGDPTLFPSRKMAYKSVPPPDPKATQTNLSPVAKLPAPLLLKIGSQRLLPSQKPVYISLPRSERYHHSIIGLQCLGHILDPTSHGVQNPN